MFVYLLILLIYIILFFLFFLLKNQVLSLFNNSDLYGMINYIVVILFLLSMIEITTFFIRNFYKTIYETFLNKFLFKIFHLILLIIVFIKGIEFLLYFKILLLNYLIILVLLLMKLLKVNGGISMPDFSFLTPLFLKDFKNKNIYYFLSNTSGVLLNRMDKIMIGIFLTLSNLGIYTISIVIGNVLNIVGASLSKIVHPQISKMINVKDFKKLKYLYKKSLNTQIYISFYVFLIIILFTENFLNLLGREYTDGLYVVYVIAMGQFLNLSAGMCGGILAYSKFYKYDLYFKILLLFLNFILNIILIPNLGILGAAIATSASLIFYNFLKLWFVYHKFKLLPYSTKNISILINFIFTFLIIKFIKKILYNNSIVYLFLFSIIGFILYNVLYYLFFSEKKGFIMFIKDISGFT